MTTDQIYGMLRIAVPMLLALMVQWGWFPQSVVDALTQPLIDAVLAVVTVGSIIWSAVANRPKALILKTAELPNVRQVVTDRATAVDAAHPAVVATQEHRL